MERKSKIEPGCRVVLISSTYPDCPNLWKIGIAERQIGPNEKSPSGLPYSKDTVGAWFVSGEGLKTRLARRHADTHELLSVEWVANGYMLALENKLMRIDDEDPDQVKVKDRELEKV